MKFFDVSAFISSSKRVFTVSKKPDWSEFKTISKITALGIIIIAIVGFVITLIMKLSHLGT